MVAIGSLPERPPGSNVIERPLHLSSDYVSRLQPLLVFFQGRSGSTWLMRLLMQDERIALHRAFIHEVKAARHWASLLLHHFEAAPWGQNPLAHEPPGEFKAWLEEDYCRQLVGFCQQSVEEFYLRLAAAQGQPTTLIWAEKARLNKLTELVRELFPDRKEVFLLRDPRDILCSARAMNLDRRQRRLHWGEGWSEEDYLRHVAAYANRLVSAWRARQEGTLLIRYEDLVADAAHELKRLYPLLGITPPDGGVEMMVSRAAAIDPGAHMTSPNVKDSVGRWRTEMSPALQELWHEQLGRSLAEVGYS